MQIKPIRDLLHQTVDFFCNTLESQPKNEIGHVTHIQPNDLNRQKAKQLLKQMGLVPEEGFHG